MGVLERKRMERDVGVQSPTVAGPALQPVAPAGLVASTVRFGPPEDPQRYVLCEDIVGTGATATVQKCFRGSEVFAVKTVDLAKMRMNTNFVKSLEKLRREVSILFSLRHPRIVTLYEVIEENDALRLVIELVEGGELFDRIVTSGTFTEPVARYIFVQVAEGLKYIHSKDIVYRDLKPENVLVDAKHSKPPLLQVKLSDFGHSKALDGYSVPMTCVGTPQYWAPEVSEPGRAAMGYDQNVDLWSLGVLLYVMLLGAYPFDGIGARIEDQIRRAHLSFKSETCKNEISEKAKQLIRSLIQVTPTKRLPLDACFTHPWVAAAPGATGLIKKLETVYNPLTVVERVPLPENLEKRAVDGLRRDLDLWMAKYRCSAVIKHMELTATFGLEGDIDMDSVEQGRVELRQLVTQHCGPIVDAVREEFTPFDQELPTVVEGGVVEVHIALQVKPGQGAGLELLPEPSGMRITTIHPVPGQPGLQANDLIARVNGHELSGDPQAVEDLFEKHFEDGAQLVVKRLC